MFSKKNKVFLANPVAEAQQQVFAEAALALLVNPLQEPEKSMLLYVSWVVGQAAVVCEVH